MILVSIPCFYAMFTVCCSGQPVEEVPSYVFATEHQDSCDTLDITYTFFYPFNYGKVSLTGRIALKAVLPDRTCVSDWRTETPAWAAG